MVDRIRSLLLAAARCAERHPQAAAIGTSAPCVVAGDLLAQRVEQSFDQRDGMPPPESAVDVPRVVSVFGWSVWYLGFAQYRIYLHVIDPIFTAARFGQRLTPLLKSVACNAIVTPFINIPLYYMWSTTRLPYQQWDFVESFASLKREWRTSSMSGIALWGPAQWFQFACVPVHLRIPFMSAVAVVWSVIISLQAQLGNVKPQKAFH